MLESDLGSTVSDEVAWVVVELSRVDSTPSSWRKDEAKAVRKS